MNFPEKFPKWGKVHDSKAPVGNEIRLQASVFFRNSVSQVLKFKSKTWAVFSNLSPSLLSSAGAVCLFFAVLICPSGHCGSPEHVDIP